MAAKKHGPLTIYSLYESSLRKSTRSQPSSQNNLLLISTEKISFKQNRSKKTDANEAKKK
jgi:hypothetical protein